MNFSAVILAGGKSSRMGCDKAWLETGGQSLLARQIGLARKVGAAEVFISGRANVDYSAFGCHVLKDIFPNVGPLAGIERALDIMQSPLLLVLAVDLPAMSEELLRRVSAGTAESFGAIPKFEDHSEPLAAFYPKAAHPLAVTNLNNQIFAVKDFADLCVKSGLACFVELAIIETRYFANWNSPADIASTSQKVGITL